jgi:putative membrane protein
MEKTQVAVSDEDWTSSNARPGRGQASARPGRHSPLFRAIGALALSVICTVTLADDVDGPNKFLGQAIQDGRAEAESCQLAEHTSTNASVRAFAKRMIQDHTAMNRRIEQLAKRKGFNLPDGESASQHAMYAVLKPLSGGAFDKAFMKHNVSDHKDDIEQFSKQAQASSDADVRSLASDALPTLREHLRLAQQTQRAISK